ncbi:multifunctional CCA addition/repair protein [Selenomonas sp. TAMA-11512]|uniref:tRNA adenylyltransferase n=1 Tax=Selenomonas sp. TAMA-11512 TaxID=3095337 RepID=UPI003085E504|nr:multifunctional CCA addition/repair protein [Selenomonas sp. TAMA-11512]
MTETAFIEAIRSMGGTVYLVGGYVRDTLLGRKPKDRDYVITNIEEAAFCRLFSSAEKVGNHFPVYLLPIRGEMREVAFARREKKTASGYRGFAAHFSPETTIEEDLARRDTTMNSIALRLPDREMIDPFGGKQDIERGIIRAATKHFAEDPVRALRAARQAAELGFTIEAETVNAMRSLRGELRSEPQERIFEELKKALAAPKPSVFFSALLEANLLDIAFPELYALHGRPEILAFHPEGDSFRHTMLVLDEVAARTENTMVRFAALVHDIGKGRTLEEMLPHHYGHELRGQDALLEWNERQKLPREWLQAGLFVVQQHMRAARLKKPGKIVDLYTAIARSALDFKGFTDIIAVDYHGLPYYLADSDLYERVMKVHAKNHPDDLAGEAVGAWLRGQRIHTLRRLCGERNPV